MYTSLFAQRRQASLLFAVSELVRSFGNDISCSQAICLSVEEVILRTAESLKTLSDFDDAPDVVDDAFDSSAPSFVDGSSLPVWL